MKKILHVLFVFIIVTSCQKYDDSELWKAVNRNSEEIAALKEKCSQMNSDILNLKTLITALQNNDYITDCSPLADGSGYSIIFKSGKSIVIKHGTNGKDGKDGEDGKDGKDGENGKDGKDGENGQTPVISVRMDSDGIYYWTLNGEWLIGDNGEKIQAQGVNGIDGENGEDGQDGVTPMFKIEDGYWFISYDNGDTWTKLGKAIGENGLNGEDGDAFFKGVTMGDGYVIFTLNDGKDTQIKLPYVTDTQLSIFEEKEGTLKNLLTLEQQRSVISLKISGKINTTDLKFINCYLSALEILDLSDATFYFNSLSGSFLEDGAYINPLKSTAINRSLRHVIMGASVDTYEVPSCLAINMSYCLTLESVTLSSDGDYISPKRTNSPNIETIYIAEGVKALDLTIYPEHAYCMAPTLVLPSTLEKIGYYAFAQNNTSTVICNAITPPTIYSGPGIYGSTHYTEPFPTTAFYPHSRLDEMKLLVPAESIDAYKAHSGWCAFGTILSIE